MERPRRALILPGGGARGAWQAAVLSELARALDGGAAPTGPPLGFDVILATSVGVANAVGLALGLAPGFPELWRDCMRSLLWVRPRELLRLRSPFGVGKAAGELVRRYGDRERLRAARGRCELVFTATDYDTGEAVLFSSRDPGWTDDERTRQFFAAITIPYVTGRPVEIRGRRYCDGGFTRNTPLESALARGIDEVLIVDPGPSERAALVGRYGAPVFEALGRLPFKLARLLAGVPKSYVDGVEAVAAAGAGPAGGATGPRVRLVRPSQPLPCGVLDLRPGPVEGALAIGLADGEDLARRLVRERRRPAPVRPG